MRRKRSPSHSDNNYNYNNNNNNNILNSAFNKLSNNSNSQNLNNNNNNNASNNDDINSNEPTEPDDSRLLPPTTITTSSSSLNTKVNDKDKRRHHLSRLTQVQDPSKRSHKRSASPAPPIKPPLISNKDVRPFNIPNSKPLTSTTVTNIITSLQPTVDTNIKPRAISNKNKNNNNNNNNNNSGNLAGLSDSSEPSSTPFSSVFSSTSNNCSIYSNSSFTSSLTSSFKKFSSGNSANSSSITRKSITNKTKHINSIFLKRYPNDSSSREGINLDEMITKLLKLNNNHTNTNGSSGKHRKHSTSSSFPIHSWEIQLICSHVREIFLMQPTLLKLQSPIKIVGDIHGQYNDLLRIFKLSGDPSETNYLFLGDYIDRGHQSLETIMLLFCYKIKYRDNFFMLRGNHESANVTKMYGFYDECKRRKSTKVWKSFIDVFNCLPIAAMIQDKIFCIHGGISPDLTSMKQISNVLRPTDIPEEGLITDLLWSDPDSNVTTWSPNDRGVSYTFSRKNVLDFCSKFKFDLIIRGHMVVEDGYEFFAKKKFVTVFSAPNYCGQFGNWGAVLSISTGLICSFELLKPHSIKR